MDYLEGGWRQQTRLPWRLAPWVRRCSYLVTIIVSELATCGGPVRVLFLNRRHTLSLFKTMFSREMMYSKEVNDIFLFIITCRIGEPEVGGVN